MLTICTRRIFRLAPMTLAALVLLPVGYVATWLTVSWTFQDECPFRWASRPFAPVVGGFYPLVRYCESDRAGSRRFEATLVACQCWQADCR